MKKCCSVCSREISLGEYDECAPKTSIGGWMLLVLVGEYYCGVVI
jgi:hypothetical protein